MSGTYAVVGAVSVTGPDLVVLQDGLTRSDAWSVATRLDYAQIPESCSVVRVVGPDGKVPFERILDRTEGR